MSTPFWIFLVALGAICLWALVSRNIFSRRIAEHNKAEAALDARMAAFKERVSARNERILAAEKPKKGPDDKSKSDPSFLEELYVTHGQVMRSVAPLTGIGLKPARFAGGGDHHLVMLGNGCVWLETNQVGDAMMKRIVEADAPRASGAYEVSSKKDFIASTAAAVKRYPRR
ncbi:MULTISPECIES: hypothetical protein [unclassified Mesorhizobium]|uniref:hypothetical protein n=1 Tax=unclassified Mesorhizobium TaxID=325217 RepID=UPI003336FEDD